VCVYVCGCLCSLCVYLGVFRDGLVSCLWCVGCVCSVCNCVCVCVVYVRVFVYLGCVRCV